MSRNANEMADVTADAIGDAVSDACFARLTAAVREAGELTMRHFRHGARIEGRIDWKTGNSPVTEVDLAVDRLLQARLSALFPQAGWLSEETADTPDRLSRRTVLVVDPIDGTRAFMEGDPRFAISVALVADGRPVAAVLDAPAIDQIFTARLGSGAFLNGRRVEAGTGGVSRAAKLAGPRFLIDPVARELDMVAQPKVPSLALRFAQVAAGDFDVAVASTDAHDWDIAAADLILNEAGAHLRTLDDETPVYNRSGTKHGILVATTDPFLAPVQRALADVTATWRNR